VSGQYSLIGASFNGRVTARNKRKLLLAIERVLDRAAETERPYSIKIGKDSFELKLPRRAKGEDSV
jgi:hypothetical protein